MASRRRSNDIGRGAAGNRESEVGTERDARGYWSLPEHREEQSYYTYGTPPDGAAQFAHPSMLSFLFAFDFHWGQVSDSKLGFGNISRRDGVKTDHGGHRTGLEIDIRPVRKDRRREPVTRFSWQYDRAETAKLVSVIRRTGNVALVYFSDPSIARVTPYPDHDNHLHVEVLP
jgi:murein endopeptidase